MEKEKAPVKKKRHGTYELKTLEGFLNEAERFGDPVVVTIGQVSVDGRHDDESRAFRAVIEVMPRFYDERTPDYFIIVKDLAELKFANGTITAKSYQRAKQLLEMIGEYLTEKRGYHLYNSYGLYANYIKE